MLLLNKLFLLKQEMLSHKADCGNRINKVYIPHQVCRQLRPSACQSRLRANRARERNTWTANKGQDSFVWKPIIISALSLSAHTEQQSRKPHTAKDSQQYLAAHHYLTCFYTNASLQEFSILKLHHGNRAETVIKSTTHLRSCALLKHLTDLSIKILYL